MKLLAIVLALSAAGVVWADNSPSNVDKSLEDFRAAAARLEHAVTQAAQENTKGFSQKINQGMSSVLSDMSKALNQAADTLEKKSGKTPKAAQTSGSSP